MTKPIITALDWVPDGAKGLVRDLRVRWALEEVGQPYDVRLLRFGTHKEGTHRARQPFGQVRSEEHTSELQSLMRISYAVFCLKKKKYHIRTPVTKAHHVKRLQN